MSRQNLRDRIYDTLIQRIRAGTFGWDDRYVDVSVAAELGVSRMPARDALMRLAAEGYLVPTTRGFVLPRLSKSSKCSNCAGCWSHAPPRWPRTR